MHKHKPNQWLGYLVFLLVLGFSRNAFVSDSDIDTMEDKVLREVQIIIVYPTHNMLIQLQQVFTNLTEEISKVAGAELLECKTDMEVSFMMPSAEITIKIDSRLDEITSKRVELMSAYAFQEFQEKQNFLRSWCGNSLRDILVSLENERAALLKIALTWFEKTSHEKGATFADFEKNVDGIATFYGVVQRTIIAKAGPSDQILPLSILELLEMLKKQEVEAFSDESKDELFVSIHDDFKLLEWLHLTFLQFSAMLTDMVNAMNTNPGSIKKEVTKSLKMFTNSALRHITARKNNLLRTTSLLSDHTELLKSTLDKAEKEAEILLTQCVNVYADQITTVFSGQKINLGVIRRLFLRSLKYHMEIAVRTFHDVNSDDPVMDLIICLDLYLSTNARYAEVLTRTVSYITQHFKRATQKIEDYRIEAIQQWDRSPEAEKAANAAQNDKSLVKWSSYERKVEAIAKSVADLISKTMKAFKNAKSPGKHTVNSLLHNVTNGFVTSSNSIGFKLNTSRSNFTKIMWMQTCHGTCAHRQAQRKNSCRGCPLDPLISYEADFRKRINKFESALIEEMPLFPSSEMISILGAFEVWKKWFEMEILVLKRIEELDTPSANLNIEKYYMENRLEGWLALFLFDDLFLQELVHGILDESKKVDVSEFLDAGLGKLKTVAVNDLIELSTYQYTDPQTSSEKIGFRLRPTHDAIRLIDGLKQECAKRIKRTYKLKHLLPGAIGEIRALYLDFVAKVMQCLFVPVEVITEPSASEIASTTEPGALETAKKETNPFETAENESNPFEPTQDDFSATFF